MTIGLSSWVEPRVSAFNGLSTFVDLTNTSEVISSPTSIADIETTPNTALHVLLILFTVRAKNPVVLSASVNPQRVTFCILPPVLIVAALKA